VPTRIAACLLAALVVGVAPRAVRASEPPAAPFEIVPRRLPGRRAHRLATVTAAVGIGLVAASFPLSAEANRRYDRYLHETDIASIDERFDATQRMDRLASGALLTGEALLATAVWLRFVHRAGRESRVSLMLSPARCAASLRF